MSGAIISVENLGKKYLLSHRVERPRYTTLRDVIAQKGATPFKALRRGGSSKIDDETPTKCEVPGRISSSSEADLNYLSPRASTGEDFWALRDVSFEVQQGEVVGIIGRNGAGKSTLLKILSRITEPTSGRVRIKGRLASLLEVGTGFHPELTGRENIFLNGAILGMSRAGIRQRFDEIVAFAEVETFLDTPVKRYSSGMYVRLAFAVAAHLEPEILIVDEVLAVGDAEFQKKCLGKMQSVSRSQGRTVLFVSHNMQAIRNLAPLSVLLSKGRIAFYGDTKTAVEKYLGQDGGSAPWEYNTTNLPRTIQGTGLAHLESVWFTAHKASFTLDEAFAIGFRSVAKEHLNDVFFAITFFNLEGESAGTSFSKKALSLRPGQNAEITLTIPSLRLAPGRYCCDLSILKGNWLQDLALHDVVRGILHFEILSPKTCHDTVAMWHSGWGAVVMSDIVTAS